MIKSFFDSYGVPALFVLFVLLFILEGKFELRKRVQSRWKRIFINFMVSIPAFALLRVLFLPVMVWLAYKNQSLHFGLNYLYQLPGWMEGAIAFLILDYGNYVWHILNHKVPLLWRFHLVHHTDQDLDLTTAFRFHFGEMIGSVFFRGTITFLSGATPLAVLVYEIFFEAATQFHHSNTRLPFRFEETLSKIFVTPRMHGIHHSDVEGELDSNYSVVFSVWDRLHKSLRLNIEQKEVVVGIPGYGDARELTVLYLLRLPFTKLRPLLLKPKRDEKSVGEDQSTRKMKP
jgi:sterol desaturase/sphingolipid hydroxylase (fatty acid hydroxylase superfamily)